MSPAEWGPRVQPTEEEPLDWEGGFTAVGTAVCLVVVVLGIALLAWRNLGGGG